MSEPQSSTETITVPGHCNRCGAEFAAEAIIFNGKPMQLRHHCSTCRPLAEAEEAARVAAEKEADRKLLAASREAEWRRICPVEYRTLAEGGLTDLERLHREFPGIAGALEWRPKTGRSLLLRGAVGRGKTRVAWRICRAEWESGITIRAFTAGEFARAYADAAGKFEARRWWDELSRVGLFFLDDLGKGSWSDGAEAQFFDLLESRCKWRRPMIVTTNETAESLGSLLSEQRDAAIVRRLREFCDQFIL